MEALTPEAAAKVVLAGLEGHQRRFSIVGRQGSGKSSTLDAVGVGLTKRGRPFVRLGFSHDEDAPFSALIDLASQLSITSPDLLHLVRDAGVGWRAKLERVTSELVLAAPVVLFDEPRSPGTTLGRGVFASCAHELSHAILSADKLRVVAGEQTHGSFVPSHAVVSVQPTSLPRQVLERAWSNKALEAAAAALMEQDATRLARYSLSSFASRRHAWQTAPAPAISRSGGGARPSSFGAPSPTMRFAAPSRGWHSAAWEPRTISRTILLQPASSTRS
ncbi:MAG: hypothetical protein IPF92_25495 [Myxococcales bacterium]|nr:hypothetical protein [Myxococcales bacterium]